jgi:hypothetical protein
LTALHPGRKESYFDFAETRRSMSDTWVTEYAVLDVDKTATIGRVSLIGHGVGTVSFDDVSVVSLGPSPAAQPAALPDLVKQRLVTMARALGLVRYFHPSDQSARVNWDDFSVRAFESVLKAPTTIPLQEILSRVFAPIVTGVWFTSGEGGAVPVIPREPQATHLARWYHAGRGSGDSSDLYLSFRDGISADESAATYAYTEVEFRRPSTCRSAELRVAVRNAAGSAWVLAMLFQSGQRYSYIREQIPARQGSTLVVHGDLPIDTQHVRLGFFLAGQSSVESGPISLACDNKEVATADPRAEWKFSRFQDFFSKTSLPCEHSVCLLVRRVAPNTEFRVDRDLADMDIGSGLHIVLPLAVWTDGKVTYPRTPDVELPPPDYTLTDLPVRVAAAASIWNTLSLFYPYFDDQRTDWNATIFPALDEVAAADSAGDVHRALSRLVARLHDGHARVRHPTQSMSGMLPLELRRFDNKIFVVGGLLEYMDEIPIGSELVSLDGVPSRDLYDANSAMLSAATPQALDYLSSLYISLGPIGDLRHLKLHTPTGAQIQLLLPLVSREQFDKRIHGKHPKQGAELSPGILYIDAAELDEQIPPTLIENVKSARAVILDARGYVGATALGLLARFTLDPVRSPLMRIPIVSIHPAGTFQDEDWTLRPEAPYSHARLVILTSARTVSAGETFLQIARDNKLATFVGESSAGTNGNVNSFVVPGRFEVRFTGMRVAATDGTTIQGHGITPDRVVHPTLQGLRSGQDEVLQAAIAVAQGRVP